MCFIAHNIGREILNANDARANLNSVFIYTANLKNNVLFSLIFTEINVCLLAKHQRVLLNCAQGEIS